MHMAMKAARDSYIDGMNRHGCNTIGCTVQKTQGWPRELGHTMHSRPVKNQAVQVGNKAKVKKRGSHALQIGRG
eukprot:1155949-Pelagomonas_calceolata.AAC.3